MEQAKKKQKQIPTFRRNYPAFRLIGGNLISFLGDQIYLIALPLIVLALTGSPVSMGIVAALERLPILFQPLTGVLADRFDRKKLMLLCDFGRGLLLGVMGLSHISGILELWHLYSGALMIGMLSQVYNTSQFASVPSLVRKKDLQWVNALNTGFFNTAILVAPGLGGLLLSFYHPGYALIINAVSFCLAGVLVKTISVVPLHSTKEHKAFLKDIKLGFQFVYQTKAILFTNVALLARVFGLTLFLTLMIFHLKDTIAMSTAQIGILLSLGGAGAIGGALVTNRLSRTFSYRKIMFTASVCGGGSIILFSISETFLFLVFYNLIGTTAAAMLNPCIATLRQTLTPKHMLGRVQATSQFMTWLLMPAAALGAGLIAEQIGTSSTILIGGSIATIASFLYLHPAIDQNCRNREESVS
ncbi:MFS transporter [Thalassobacillus pellis]|uniref:MFS transporter n=1 Tax=Thalassobacillus pellis TaxID=748008 RepID=UPI001961B498|nr:MFS transporter [Thalassobacillus pellis]MBM7554160.1 MFS family permease [Thalassobacillus pellis]